VGDALAGGSDSPLHTVPPAHSASAVKDLLSSSQKIDSAVAMLTLLERFHAELGLSRRFARQRTCGLSGSVVRSRVSTPAGEEAVSAVSKCRAPPVPLFK
jgi:hypothetical protein